MNATSRATDASMISTPAADQSPAIARPVAATCDRPIADRASWSGHIRPVSRRAATATRVAPTAAPYTMAAGHGRTARSKIISAVARTVTPISPSHAQPINRRPTPSDSGSGLNAIMVFSTPADATATSHCELAIATAYTANLG